MAFDLLGGAALGALSGLLGLGKGKKDKIKQMKNFTPEEEEYLDMLLQGAKGGLPSGLQYLQSILGDEEGAFEDFEAPAKQQFEQEIIPSILERFSGMGARSSSALNQTLGQAGKELSTNLAAQRANLKQGALEQLLGIGKQGLTSKTTPYLKKGKPSFLESMAPFAGQFASNFLLG